MQSIPHLKLIENSEELSDTDPKDIEKNISQFSNEKLCEIIVSFRYLGLMREEAVICMTELSNRRVAGSIFNYEKGIQDIIDSLPKIDIDLNDMFKKFKVSL